MDLNATGKDSTDQLRPALNHSDQRHNRICDFAELFATLGRYMWQSHVLACLRIKTSICQEARAAVFRQNIY